MREGRAINKSGEWSPTDSGTTPSRVELAPPHLRLGDLALVPAAEAGSKHSPFSTIKNRQGGPELDYQEQQV